MPVQKLSHFNCVVNENSFVRLIRPTSNGITGKAARRLFNELLGDEDLRLFLVLVIQEFLEQLSGEDVVGANPHNKTVTVQLRVSIKLKARKRVRQIFAQQPEEPLVELVAF